MVRQYLVTATASHNSYRLWAEEEMPAFNIEASQCTHPVVSIQIEGPLSVQEFLHDLNSSSWRPSICYDIKMFTGGSWLEVWIEPSALSVLHLAPNRCHIDAQRILLLVRLYCAWRWYPSKQLIAWSHCGCLYKMSFCSGWFLFLLSP